MLPKAKWPPNAEPSEIEDIVRRAYSGRIVKVEQEEPDEPEDLVTRFERESFADA